MAGVIMKSCVLDVVGEMCCREHSVRCWYSHPLNKKRRAGDEGPVGGVGQVDCHGVKVVGVHGEEGQGEDGEMRREVKGEVEELREKRSSWMVWRWCDKRVNGLEPMWV